MRFENFGERPLARQVNDNQGTLVILPRDGARNKYPLPFGVEPFVAARRYWYSFGCLRHAAQRNVGRRRHLGR
jgi:hypothetical protein